MFEEMEDPRRDDLGGRLQPAEHEVRREGTGFGVREPAFVHGRHEDRHEIVGRCCPPDAEQIVEIPREFSRGDLSSQTTGLGHDEERVDKVDRPLTRTGAVLFGDANDRTGNPGDEREREVRPQIDGRTPRHVIGKAARDLSGFTPVALDRFRGEPSRDCAAQALVFVAVLSEHQVRPQVEQLALGDTGEHQRSHCDGSEALVREKRFDIVASIERDGKAHLVGDHVRPGGVDHLPTAVRRDAGHEGD